MEVKVVNRKCRAFTPTSHALILVKHMLTKLPTSLIIELTRNKHSAAPSAYNIILKVQTEVSLGLYYSVCGVDNDNNNKSWQRQRIQI